MVDLLVAAEPGLTVVSVPADGGEPGFEVARPGTVHDLASVPGSTDDATGLAVATDEDVLHAPTGVIADLAPTGFGPATAVSYDGDRVVAGGPDGRVAGFDGAAWRTVGELQTAPRAMDGPLVGTDDGIFRLVGDDLRYAGLEAAVDVAHAAGIPLAATAAGCYELGNGWMDVLPGDGRLVAGDPDGRALAATAERAVERVDGSWRPVDWPEQALESPAVAAAFGADTYVFTGAGDLLVGGTDGWREHRLGLEAVRAAEVVRSR